MGYYSGFDACKPPHAIAKFYLATCFLWLDHDAKAPDLAGITWWHDLLFQFSIFFHNCFIAPFQPCMANVPSSGFPFRIVFLIDRTLPERLEMCNSIL